VADAAMTSNTARVAARTVSLTSLWIRLEERWEALQVGRQGSYSVERLVSLEHYCRTTSKVRVVAVCLLTPLPAFAVAVLLECLPLRNPSEGWAANWVFWVRWSVMFFAISFSGVSQLITFVPGLNFTFAKRMMVSVGSTAAFVGTCIAGANLIRFPVPFMMQLGSVVMGLYIAGMVRLVFTRKEFGRNSALRPYFQRFYRFLFAYLMLGGLFPFYRLVFDLTPASGRAVVILLLPVWKFAAKHFIVKAIRKLEDFIPELVAFTVDFFSALFVSACMTTSGSLYLSIVFIAADVAQSLLEFNEVRGQARTVLQLLRSRRESRDRSLQKKGRRTSSTDNTDLLALILYVARHPRTFHVVSLETTRLWACLPHPLTDYETKQMQELEATGVYGGDNHQRSQPRRPQERQRIQPQLHSVSIEPAPTSLVASIPPGSGFTAYESRASVKDSGTNLRHAERSKKLVVQGLQLLFHCEYLALVEYVECVVPLVFVTYKSILNQLPNAAYYPDAPGSWGMSAVTNLLVFAALEIATFMLFIRFLHKKFSFSPLYQLAFVFETQSHLVQAKLVIEIVTLLQSRLAHFGGGYAANIEHKG